MIVLISQTKLPDSINPLSDIVGAVHQVIQANLGEMRMGKLPDGRQVKVRPSNDGGRGRYTLEVIKTNGKTEREIRYGKAD